MGGNGEKWDQSGQYVTSDVQSLGPLLGACTLSHMGLGPMLIM